MFSQDFRVRGCSHSGFLCCRSVLVPSFRFLGSVVRFFVASFWFWGSRKHLPRVCKRWFPNGGSSLVRRPNSGIPFQPQFYLHFTSVLPQFYLSLTSSLPQFNLCSAGNLEPRFGNHGLQTLGCAKITLCQNHSFGDHPLLRTPQESLPLPAISMVGI